MGNTLTKLVGLLGLVLPAVEKYHYRSPSASDYPTLFTARTCQQ
jgi:hypothetical protein